MQFQPTVRRLFADLWAVDWIVVEAVIVVAEEAMVSSRWSRMFLNVSVAILNRLRRIATPYSLVFGGFWFRVTDGRTDPLIEMRGRI